MPSRAPTRRDLPEGLNATLVTSSGNRYTELRDLAAGAGVEDARCLVSACRRDEAAVGTEDRPVHLVGVSSQDGAQITVAAVPDSRRSVPARRCEAFAVGTECYADNLV